MAHSKKRNMLYLQEKKRVVSNSSSEGTESTEEKTSQAKVNLVLIPLCLDLYILKRLRERNSIYYHLNLHN